MVKIEYVDGRVTSIEQSGTIEEGVITEEMLAEMLNRTVSYDIETPMTWSGITLSSCPWWRNTTTSAPTVMTPTDQPGIYVYNVGLEEERG